MIEKKGRTRRDGGGGRWGAAMGEGSFLGGDGGLCRGLRGVVRCLWLCLVVVLVQDGNATGVRAVGNVGGGGNSNDVIREEPITSTRGRVGH